ncbi:MAG: hypothetical protein P4L73_03765 [Caulobacteraceae bacterium]|nr:hypothetical protein [Caulobacteraceae bacterium]
MALYDYLTLQLARGPAPRARFVEALKTAALGADGRAVGLFAAQLGWEASQVALLVQRAEGQAGVSAALDAVVHAPEVRGRGYQVLRPTVRPRPGDVVAHGGIYVHRWFEVAADSFDDFVALSAEAWPDFEARFDARIFGLFEQVQDDPSANRRLLLVTRYASHGVWEDSRDPTTQAMQTFARRAALTLSTQAASTLLVPL